MTHQLTAYPDALRPHVAQILRHHYESDSTRLPNGRGGISVTGAVIERASMLSMRMRTCPTCLGSKTENIALTDKRVISIQCWRCCGDGEIGEVKKTVMQEQTVRCARCKGAGTLPRPEYRKERVYDPKPLKCDGCKGRGYHHMDTVLCGTGEYEQAQRVGGEAHGEASDALAMMRESGQERSRVVLEIAYGEVGRRVERQHHLPVAMAVWPHTSHGKRLLRELGHYRGEPPYAAMSAALSGDLHLAARASLANTAAIAVLELALSHLFVADGLTGGRVGTLARKLEGARV